jgi:RNA polymerase sigma-70 factor (ECF subfamily)
VEAVQRFVARRVADPHLAADLTAEVFLAAISSANTYRADRGSVTGWLYGVAHNVVSAERRRKARELRAHQRVAGRRLLNDDDVARLEERIDAEAKAREFIGAMSRLGKGERAVLELVVVDDLTLKDAAQALGIKQVTARVRFHRAKRALLDHSAAVRPFPVTSEVAQ